MPIRLAAVAFDAREPTAGARFWAELLGREAVDEADGVLLPGREGQVRLRFVTPSCQKVGLNRLHLHLTSSDPEEQRATVEKALSLGGSRAVGLFWHEVLERQTSRGATRLADSDEGVELADPDGNEFRIVGAWGAARLAAVRRASAAAEIAATSGHAD